jgi:O-acetylhomoserine (thiol)-lyase
MSASHKPETLALHAGWRADPATGAVAVPIYQTTSYQFHNAEHAANLFALKELGNIYTRIMNPTNDVLEKRVAALEGGVAGLALASGQAASAFAIQNLARAGDNVVSSTDLYGGTWNLFANTMKDQGIEVRFVDPADPQNFARATDARTRAYYAETLPNPKLIAFPISEVAAIGRPLGIPLIMDNTAAPLLVRPFDHGAAIIVYSSTKYLGGHGTSIGGLLIDSGNFPWEEFADRQPALNTPDPSYHGAIWTEAVKPLGPIAYIIKARTTLLRDLGSAMAPFNAFLTLQGIETLPLRIERHCANASAVARFLSERPEVEKVIHPSRQTGVAAERAAKYLKAGQGGLVGFEIKGGREAGRRFIDALQLLYHVANIGDARSLAIHPATTTHSQLSPEDQLATGVTEGYVRLSIGLEHIDDIVADLDQALKASQG